MYSRSQHFLVVCSYFVGLRTRDLSSVHFDMSIVVFIQLIFNNSCLIDTLWVQLLILITKRPSLIAHFLMLWLLQYFCPLFCMLPEPQMQELFCRCIHWDQVTQHYNFIGLGFCNDPSLLQRDVSLIKSEDYTYLWV